MMRSTCAAVLAALILAGCYTYIPSGLSEIGLDQDVRVRLDPTEAARLDDFVKQGTRSVEGTVVEQETESLLLLVQSHSELRGNRVETLHQRIKVEHTGILDVELKRLDKGRTYLVTGAAVAALTAIAVSRLFAEGGSSTDPPGPPPDESLIPLFSVRLPFRIFSLLGG